LDATPRICIQSEAIQNSLSAETDKTSAVPARRPANAIGAQGIALTGPSFGERMVESRVMNSPSPKSTALAVTAKPSLGPREADGQRFALKDTQ
jgi:hypothetical protein